MSLSVMVAFAKFLQDQGYTTTMWEGGCSTEDVNEVCHVMTGWVQETFLEGAEFVVLWANQEGTAFSGDCELVCILNNKAYLVPNPFLEGETEGFIETLQHLVDQRLDALFDVPVHSRILYNAV